MKLRKFSYSEPRKEGGNRNVVFVEGGTLQNDKVKIDSIISEVLMNGNTKVTIRVIKSNEITIWKELIINSSCVCVSEYNWEDVL